MIALAADRKSVHQSRRIALALLSFESRVNCCRNEKRMLQPTVRKDLSRIVLEETPTNEISTNDGESSIVGPPETKEEISK